MKLTVKKVEKLTDHGRYSDGGNLFLQVTTKGHQSWLFRFKVWTGKHEIKDGKKIRKYRDRWMGLGPVRYPKQTLLLQRTSKLM